MIACLRNVRHSWRLIRHWTESEVVTPDQPHDTPGNYATRSVVYREWYCVNCRKFDTTRDPEMPA